MLAANVEDHHTNTTRFLVLAREPVKHEAAEGPMITTFVFRVRNIPAALFKALGGFATNGVNITKLESYQLGGRSRRRSSTPIWKGTRRPPSGAGAGGVGFFSVSTRILGTYPASPYRALQ